MSLTIGIWPLIILTIASLITSTLSGVIGMGGGVLLLSVMTFFLTFKELIPIHGIVQLVSNSSRTWLLKKHVVKPIWGFFCLGLPIGVIISIYIIKSISNKNYFFLLISGLIFYTIFKPKKLPGLNLPNWGFIFVGAAVGFLGLLVGATGPFIAPFFLRPDFKKENIVATKAAVQVMGHLVKIPAFLHLGFHYEKYWVVILSLTVMAILGTKIGVLLLGKIDTKLFKRLFKIALFIAGVRLVYKVFWV